MVLGGLILEAADAPRVDRAMARFRAEVNMWAEFKWSKVSNQKLREYERIVNYFFAMNERDRIHFHCLIIDNHAVDHRRWNKGDKELGFYKFYYQLLLHSFGRRYCREGESDRIQVHLDSRTSSYPLHKLKSILNNAFASRYQTGCRPFVSVEPRDSKKSPLLQVNDILLGGVGWAKNRHSDRAGAKESKKYLSGLILQRAGIRSLDFDTRRQEHRFGIWNFRLRS